MTVRMISRQFAIELRNDFAHGLGGTSSSRNDVVVNSTTTTPVLVRWAINSLLSGSSSMDCSHQTLNDPELGVNDLRQCRKAVGGAGSIRNLNIN